MGRVTTASATVLYAADPPVITLGDVHAETDQAELLISGEVTTGAAPLASVTVRGLPVLQNSAGSFQTLVTLKAGLNRITVKATDQAGNTATASVSVQLVAGKAQTQKGGSNDKTQPQPQPPKDESSQDRPRHGGAANDSSTH